MHRSLEWARYLGALLPKRMIASWSGSQRTQPNTSMRRRVSRPTAGSPRFVSLSFTPLGLTAARHQSRDRSTRRKRVPWCSLRKRSGTRHARAKSAARGSVPLFPSAARRGLGGARSGRKSRAKSLDRKSPIQVWAGKGLAGRRTGSGDAGLTDAQSKVRR